MRHVKIGSRLGHEVSASAQDVQSKTRVENRQVGAKKGSEIEYSRGPMPFEESYN